MLVEFVDGPLRGRRAPASVAEGKRPRFLIAHVVRDLPGLIAVEEYELEPAPAGQSHKARWVRFVRYQSAGSPTTVFILDADQQGARTPEPPPDPPPPPGARGNGSLLRV